MFRSILKGSFLAASFCVIALSSNAHAKNAMNLVSSGDVNLKETSAGRAYAADKKAGATCPFATKGDRDAATAVADAGKTTASGGFASGKTTVH